VTSPAFILAAATLLVAASGVRAVEVDHPFYLTFIEDPRDVALFRCPDGPDRGCAIDGLPGPRVLAAGANKRFVVILQQSKASPRAPARYYYFARVPGETRGWGNNPEKIVGPMDEAAFSRARAKLDLPDFTVRP
jgi:hypothetical protein